MKLTYLFVIILLGLSLFIFSCGGDDDDDDVFDPTDIEGIGDDVADWLVTINSNDWTKGNYMIMANYLGSASDLSASDTVSLKVNDETYPLLMMTLGLYHAQVTMTAGTSYDVQFIHNGTVKAETTVKTVYHVTADFPETWNPAQSTSFFWNLSGDNQYQVAGGNSSHEDDFDEYSRSISPSARSFSVPGGQVDLYGPGTYYILFVDEMNFKVVSRVAFLCWQGDYQNYGGSSFRRSLEEQHQHGKQLYNLLLERYAR